MATLREAALKYARAGRPVLPLAPGGKVPLIPGGAGVKDATTDLETIERWWHREPRANIGLACSSDFFALDIDAHKGGPESLHTLELEHGALPETLTQATPTTGLHRAMRAPEGTRLRNAVAFAPGLDIRCQGGYIVASPSIVGGGRYRWINRAHVAQAPAWLVDLVRAREIVRSPYAVRVIDHADNHIISRARRYLSRMPPAISGQGGHRATFLAARALVLGFNLADRVALELLLEEFNPKCRPQWSERELAHKVQSARRQAQGDSGFLLNASRAA